MFTVLKIDLYLSAFLRIIAPHNTFFNYFFSFFSLKGNSLPIWIVIILIVLILEERKNPGISKKDVKFLVLFFLSFVITSILSTYILKNIFRRPRPTLTKTSINVSLPTTNHQSLITSNCPCDFSFPSSHAAAAFASFAVLSFFDKKKRLFYLTIASLISYSRIYLYCHYFLDIVGGALIGYFTARLILKVKLNKCLDYLQEKYTDLRK